MLVTEIDLPELPVRDAEFAKDAEPLMAAARKRHPWLARSEIGYVVHGYKAIKDIMPMEGALEPAAERREVSFEVNTSARRERGVVVPVGKQLVDLGRHLRSAAPG